MARPRGCVLGVATFLATAVASGADERPDLTTLSLEELARTKVTSVSKKEGPRFQTPAAIHVITSDDIRRSGATSIPEALRLAPGIHVARINSSQWGIGIRGFTNRLARSQLALMDGRSLYTPLFAGTYWEVQDTLLDDVERIEIVLGPGGTLWGANAVSGIVNIITKDAKDTQGWFASAGGGTEERAFAQVRYGGSVGDNGHYRLYGKYFDRDAAFHADGDDYDGWHMARGGFRSDWRLPRGDHLTVQGDAYTGRAGQRTSVSFYEPPFSRTVQAPAEFSGGNLLTRWDRRVKGSLLTVHAYYDRTRRVEPTFQEVRDTFDIDLQDQFGLGDRQSVVFGFGYRRSSGKTEGTDTVAFVPADRTDHIVSAFVQDEVDVVEDRLRLALGVKLLRNQYTGFEFQPSARLLWTPRPRQTAWAAVTRAVRTPSRIERDLAITASLSPTLPVFARLLGDEGFTSERVWSFEAGYRLQPIDRLSLDLALFSNRHQDLLSLESGPPFVEQGRQIVPLRIANGGRGRTSGLELGSRLQASSRWWLSGTYAYLDMDLAAEPGSTDTSQAATEGASPRHRIRIQSSWSLPGQVDLDLIFRWIDELPAQNVTSFASADARVGWHVSPRLELAVVGQNLLHDHHAEFGSSGGAVEVERGVYGEARWRW